MLARQRLSCEAVAEDRQADQRHILLMGGVGASPWPARCYARWPLRISARIAAQVAQLDERDHPGKNSRQTMLRKPTVTPFTQTRHIFSCNYYCANIRKAACRDKLKRPFFRICAIVAFRLRQPRNAAVKSPCGGDFHATDLPGPHFIEDFARQVVRRIHLPEADAADGVDARCVVGALTRR